MMSQRQNTNKIDFSKQLREIINPSSSRLGSQRPSEIATDGSRRELPTFAEANAVVSNQVFERRQRAEGNRLLVTSGDRLITTAHGAPSVSATPGSK